MARHSLLFALALLMCGRIVVAQPDGERTLIIRRGGKDYSVTIDNKVESQVQLWNGLRDRTSSRLADYLESGKGYRSYMDNFLYRYKPEAIHEQLLTAFGQCSQNEITRARAARLLIQFGDFRGVDWALTAIHTSGDQESKKSILGVFDSLFRFEQKTNRPQCRFQFTPGLEHLLENSAKGKTLAKWIARIDGDDWKGAARRIVSNRNDSYAERVLEAYARTSPDEWLIKHIQTIIKRNAEAKTRQDIRTIPVNCFLRLCHDQDERIRMAATEAYMDYIRSSQQPAYACLRAITSGVSLPEPFFEEIRDQLRSSVAADIESSQNRAPEKIAKAGWAKYSTEELSRIFVGTNDAEVLDILDTRYRNGTGTEPTDILSIEIVSGEKTSNENLELVRKTKLAIPQMEFHCRIHGKSPGDLFQLFQLHGYPPELNATEITRRLRAKRAVGEYYNEMLMPPDQFSMHELAREVFRTQSQWVYLSYERYLDSFWRMVDATNGEFAPDHFTILDDAKRSGRMVGFTWNGARYRFPFRSAAGFVPQLNAILNDSGSKNGFVQFTGRPSGGFLTASTPKVAYGPIELLETLEKEFGMAVSFR